MRTAVGNTPTWAAINPSSNLNREESPEVIAAIAPYRCLVVGVRATSASEALYLAAYSCWCAILPAHALRPAATPPAMARELRIRIGAFSMRVGRPEIGR